MSTPVPTRRVDASQRDDRLSNPEASLECCDEEALPTPLTGDPVGLQVLLDQFAARMAEHGRAVHCAEMRNDREYALWQIARARATDDEALRSVAARLFARWADPSGGRG
ncbi:hypothetical protein WG922_04595 [Ramlibacter sp. AN1015]|uniref:hypothetical protein n=1 Tax=Ramlibacter sp. AN1015 TaxID=3133428 RepID=UPI0030C1254B